MSRLFHLPLVFTLLPLAIGCQRADPPTSLVGQPPALAAPTRLVVVGPQVRTEAMDLMVARFAELLDRISNLPVTVVQGGQATPAADAYTFALGAGALSGRLIPAEQIQALGEETFAVKRGVLDGGVVYAAVGSNLLGDQYGAYALLEELGVGFFHPEQLYLPDQATFPTQLDRVEQPTYHWRGIHLHTMHPIEMMDTLLVPGAEHLAEGERYVEWLIANRQDYFQWALQDTVDMEAWVPHARALVEHAQLRGLRVGIDTPFRFIQQNGWVLVPHRGPWEPQIKARLAQVLQVPFDVINVELGASEFIPEEDTETVEMLEFTAAHLWESYGVELISKVHVSEGQTAPNYGDINYNFLPGLCSAAVGVLPHTVQFYDLYRPAPTYDNEDFSHIREFLLDEIDERRVLYYPETAYWVSFDVDVPLFLPQYVYARWLDLYNLRGSGMDGQVNFSSGFEWGYWLGDFAAAAFAWDADQSWQSLLARFTRIFGSASDEMQALLVEITEQQADELLLDNQIRWIIGWDTADDFGHLVNIHAQPVRQTFFEVDALDAAGLDTFEQESLSTLATLEQTYLGFSARMDALAPQIPSAAQPWYLEMSSALKVTTLRIGHVRRLYEGVVARARFRLGTAPTGMSEAQVWFDEAQALRREGEAIVADQESRYRYDVARIARPRENATSYEFGYLYQVSDLYYWRREELQAIDEMRCPCLGNLADQLANLFGEGHPLQRIVEAIPDIPPDCLNMCLNPMTSISEVGGSQ